MYCAKRYGIQVQCFLGQQHQHLRLLLPEDVGANQTALSVFQQRLPTAATQ